jgi:hypothetical protein
LRRFEFFNTGSLLASSLIVSRRGRSRDSYENR